MISGEYWKLLDDAEIRKIDGAAVRLLERVGCRVDHEGLLKLLEGVGCRIDYVSQRCYFPEKVVRRVVGHVGGKPKMAFEIPAGWNPQHHLSHGGSYPHLLEWPSGERRLATRRDVVAMAKMAHVLPEFTHVGKVLTCCDVDQRIEPLWAALQLAKITDKPVGGGEIFHAHYIGPLVRMGEVLSGRANDTSLVAACDFFIAPLIMDRKQAECFIEKRRFEISNAPGTMPVTGMSSPVTLAGTVTVAVAELLAGWVMGYACNPTLKAGGIVCTGTLDMRTLAACFSSPEAKLQDAAVVNICRRLYGIPVGAAIGYVDAKRPGLEATIHKMLPLIGAAVGTGTHFHGGGLLSAGQDYSPVQHLLDAEVGMAVQRFWGHFEVNDETLALDLIEKIATSSKTDFLDTDHTLAHYRSEHWYPRWLDRRLWQGTEHELRSESETLARIDRHCKEAVVRYTPPAIDPSKIRELTKIFRAAEKSILGVNVTEFA